MVWAIILCSRLATRASQTDLRAAARRAAARRERERAGHRQRIHRETHSV